MHCSNVVLVGFTARQHISQYHNCLLWYCQIAYCFIQLTCRVVLV